METFHYYPVYRAHVLGAFPVVDQGLAYDQNRMFFDALESIVHLLIVLISHAYKLAEIVANHYLSLFALVAYRFPVVHAKRIGQIYRILGVDPGKIKG